MREENSELNLYLEKIREIPFLSQEEEKTLFGFILNGNRKAVAQKADRGDKTAKVQLVKDRDAKQKIVESHLWVVYKVARKYTVTDLSFFDMIQEGNLSLYRAIDKFEIEKNCRFCFYAQYWIRVQFGRFIQAIQYANGLIGLHYDEFA